MKKKEERECKYVSFSFTKLSCLVCCILTFSHCMKNIIVCALTKLAGPKRVIYMPMCNSFRNMILVLRQNLALYLSAEREDLS